VNSFYLYSAYSRGVAVLLIYIYIEVALGPGTLVIISSSTLYT